MGITQGERNCAREFCFLLLAGAVILAGIIGLWGQAFVEGGNWWWVFLGAFAVSLYLGERIKRRMEAVLKMSREARGAGAVREPTVDA